MGLTKFLGVAAIFAAATASQAQEAGVLLTMTIEKDGVILAKPRLITKLGSNATIQSDQAFRIGVTPSVTDGIVDLAMQLYLPSDQGLKLSASPRVTTKLDTPSSIEFQAPGESRYKISVLATSHTIGKPLPSAQ